MVCRLHGRAASRSFCILTFLMVFVPGPLSGRERYLPVLRFRALTTPHFTIYFHQGEEPLARRLAGIAEDVHRTLTIRLGTAPLGRTHVVLVDQNDSASGRATPLPYNTIELSAAWPAAHELIGNTDDWLRSVFTHEYAHILQLEKSAGWAAGLRRVLGRSPLVFPNLSLPVWQIEGLATFEESAVTGRGRIPAGSFRAIVDEAVRSGRPEPLDRAGGGLVDWPGANAAYAYGGYFYQYLAGRFGEQKLVELLKATAGRFHYLQSPAFRRVFGTSLGDLWEDFERSRAAALEVGARDDGPRPMRLTSHGFLVSTPRFVPASETDGPATSVRVLYSLSNADDFPALMSIGADGFGDRRIASRYSGDGLGVGRGLAWFSQLDLSANVALRGDLYVLDLRSRRVARVTHNWRLLDPDIAPDGRTLACVMLQPGRRFLAILDVDHSPEPRVKIRQIVGEDGTQFSSPRWSPDGRFVVAARAGLHRPSEIVLVDTTTGTLRTLATSRAARNVTPCWTPDGRTVLFASDRDGGPFNLYAVDVDPANPAVSPGSLLRITRLPGGASEPDVSPDGRMVVYVGYTAKGYDLFTLPLDRARWEPAAPDDVAPDSTPPQPQIEAPSPLNTSVYSPVRTLLPRAWLPAVETADRQLKLGVAIGSSDVLSRHSYDATLLWRFARDGATGRTVTDIRPDWRAAYAYTRWRPTLFVSGSESTELLNIRATSRDPDPVGSIRDREWLAGLRVPFRTVRRAQAVEAAFSSQRRLLTSRAARVSVHQRNAIRLAWSFNSAKIFDYSISPEQGAAIGVTSEHVRTAFGAHGNADAATAEVRSYLRLGGRHAVLAARAGFGVASGDPAVGRWFYLGGPGPAGSLVDFGTGALSLLRGFDTSVFQGRRIVNAGLEYRLPLWSIQRGHGTWPVFAHTLHAAAFIDAGNTWDRGLDAGRLKCGYGAELSLDVVLGYALPLTASLGIAWPRDPSVPGRRSASPYFRIGRAF